MSRIFLIMIFYFASEVSADEMVIFDVRHSIRLADDEIAYRDYYINAGSLKGLKPGQVFTVRRSLSLYDSYQNRSPGELVVDVAEVKIIFSQDHIAVARDYKYFDRSELPLIEQDFVMIGDRLDPTTAKPAQK